MISKLAVERLKNTFLCQEVVFFLKDLDVTTTDQDGNQVTSAAMVPGFVIDICENYWWVGTPDGQVSRVISHDVSPMVELAIPALDIADILAGEGVH